MFAGAAFVAETDPAAGDPDSAGGKFRSPGKKRKRNMMGTRERKKINRPGYSFFESV